MSEPYLPQLEWLNRQWHLAMVEAGAPCVQRCDQCGRFRLPPRRFCPECFSPAASFVAAAGQGTVVSYAVSHRSLDRAWSDQTPFVTLVVELAEGPRVVAATAEPPGALSIGTEVTVAVAQRRDDFLLLLAAPLKW